MRHDTQSLFFFFFLLLTLFTIILTTCFPFATKHVSKQYKAKLHQQTIFQLISCEKMCALIKTQNPNTTLKVRIFFKHSSLVRGWQLCTRSDTLRWTGVKIHPKVCKRVRVPPCNRENWEPCNDARFVSLWRTRTENHFLEVGSVRGVDPLNLAVRGVFTLYNFVLCVIL